MSTSEPVIETNHPSSESSLGLVSDEVLFSEEPGPLDGEELTDQLHHGCVTWE